MYGKLDKSFDMVADRVFCHTCMKAFKEKKMKFIKNADPALVSFVFLNECIIYVLYHCNKGCKWIL